jgi:hypothetical protein
VCPITYKPETQLRKESFQTTVVLKISDNSPVSLQKTSSGLYSLYRQEKI